MRIEVTIPSEVLTPDLRILYARNVLHCVVDLNRALIRLGVVPRLYDTGTVYAPEQDGEEFADAYTVYKRGWGDCDDLACWLLAELLEDWECGGRKGREPRLVVQAYPRRTRDPNGLVHVLVSDSRGIDLDPSRELGM